MHQCFINNVPHTNQTSIDNNNQQQQINQNISYKTNTCAMMMVKKFTDKMD